MKNVFRLFVFAIGLGILSTHPSSQSTNSQPQKTLRTVNGQVITSTEKPAVRIEFDKVFKYVGGQDFILYDVARAEQHFFIDADKENYINYFNMIVPMMKKGGVILSDNVLWSGKVLEEVKANDKSTKILLKYNQLLKDDSRVETVLLPIRDGLTVSRVL